MRSSTVAIGLGPNVFGQDSRLALYNLLSPFTWKKGKNIGVLERLFAGFLNQKYSFSFNSGRSALAVGLCALDLPKGAQVLLQAMSCVVVANSIKYAGGVPVFADTVKRGTGMDPEDLERKITAKTRAIIVQNLFGIPDNLEKIMLIAKRHNLAVIEDCAQSLGARYHGRKSGSFGVFSIYSLGRDKIISSTFGGLLLTNDDKIAERVKKLRDELPYPGCCWIFRQLLHPVAFSIIVPSYFGLGKLLLFLMRFLGLIDLPVKNKERNGELIGDYPKLLPNALASLAIFQFKRLDKFNKKRIEIAQYYEKEIIENECVQKINISKICQPVFLRYPLFVKNRDNFLSYMKTRKIILGNWYDVPVAPKGTNEGKAGYIEGSCPNAEATCRSIINLPTYPRLTPEDIKAVTVSLNQYYGNNSK